jgi:hypothetical protein
MIGCCDMLALPNQARCGVFFGRSNYGFRHWGAWNFGAKRINTDNKPRTFWDSLFFLGKDRMFKLHGGQGKFTPVKYPIRIMYCYIYYIYCIFLIYTYHHVCIILAISPTHLHQLSRPTLGGCHWGARAGQWGGIPWGLGGWSMVIPNDVFQLRIATPIGVIMSTGVWAITFRTWFFGIVDFLA